MLINQIKIGNILLFIVGSIEGLGIVNGFLMNMMLFLGC